MDGSKTRRLDDWGTDGGHLSVIPEQSPEGQEIRADEPNKPKAARGIPGKAHAKKYLAHYRNAGLETASEELAPIWFRTKSKSSSIKQVSGDTHASGPVEIGSLVKSHFKKYWAAESARKTKTWLP